MNKFIVASALLLVAVTGAQAADVVAQEAAPTYNWSGVYVGGQVGYAWGKSPFGNRSHYSVEGGSIEYVEGTNYDPDGFFGGIYAGYISQLANNVVLGIDADLNFTDINGGGDDYSWSRTGSSGGVYEFADPYSKLRWNGAVRARVGYAYDRFLPYIAGGVSFGEYKFGLVDKDDGTAYFSETASMTGWNIGAGVEYAATGNLILRAEYRFTDFGSKTFHGIWEMDEARIKLRTNDVRIGIAYKF